MPKGYKLLSPEEDQSLAEYFLEEDGRASLAGEISSFRDKLSETVEKLNESREQRLKVEEKREHNREVELKLREREMQLQEARSKREAKKDKMMLKLLEKFVTSKAAESSDDDSE